MEWPTSSFQPSREDPHPDSLCAHPFLFPRSPAVPESQPASSIPANHANWAFTSVAGFSRSIEPHGWTVNSTGLSGGRNILSQGGVALTAQAYDEIPVDSPDALYASSGQPRPDRMSPDANTNSALIAPNSGTSNQRNKAPESAHRPPVFECKWQGCPSSTRFSSKGDLVRHIKSIHVAPDAYSCQNCGKFFGRKDHLRDHQRRRHRGLV
ncbi:hypothetical protein BDV59DRAFT_193173 [Aspergillus ambiguus]|uniref:C2H2-type zinc finger protein n=1 Tax=Aspergillus ambiguus TaxID=176160 RepID=UPI003CCE3DEE